MNWSSVPLWTSLIVYTKRYRFKRYSLSLAECSFHIQRLDLYTKLMSNVWIQKEITLKPHCRGFHLVTQDILKAVPELSRIQTGIAQVFIKHTSASLTLCENASQEVGEDLESHFNTTVPDHAPYYTHTLEGPDDMPAHIKSAIIGCSVQFPIHGGRPMLGTWQGIFLCEHRNAGGTRTLVITAFGEADGE